MKTVKDTAGTAREPAGIATGTDDAAVELTAGRPGRMIGWLLLIATVVGTPAFTILGDGLRSGGSYLGGIVLTGGVFAVGQFNLRMANQISPGLTLAVAMFSYLLTVVGLEIVLAASQPTVIDPVAIAVGLMVGVVGWLGRLIDVLRVRPEKP